MFAEELGANAGRKRAEANRAKRLQLKQQQQQKEQQRQKTTAAATAALPGAAATSTTTPVSLTTTPVSLTSTETTANIITPASLAASASTLPTSSTTTNVSSPAAASSNGLLFQTPAPPSSLLTLSTPTTTTSSNNNFRQQQQQGPKSAVERAKEQRELRAAEALQLQQAIRIQSFYKCYKSNQQLRLSIKHSLSQKLSDLKMLSKILRDKKNVTVYVPPPATTTALVQELIFIMFTIPYHLNGNHHNNRAANIRPFTNDTRQLMESILTYAIIPGLETTDENLNPFYVWIQSKSGGGRRRFKVLLRLVLMAVVDTPPLATTNTSSQHVNEKNTLQQSALKFLRLILGVCNDENAESSSSSSKSCYQQAALVQYCRSLLLLQEEMGGECLDPAASVLSVSVSSSSNATHAAPSNATTSTTITGSSSSNSMDLIAMLRHYLLFVATRNTPIPPAAQDLREACIPAQHRHVAGNLLQLLIQAALASVANDAKEEQQRVLLVRIFTEIWTVPLLSWKISAEALSFVMSCDKKAAATCGFCYCSHFLTLLQAFVDEYGQGLATTDTKIDVLLPNADVPLTKCPATNAQCLLANLVQMGRICPIVNGQQQDMTIVCDWRGAAVAYYDLLTLLLDVIPLGTFSSRDSAVEWISDGKGHHTPIVLSPVILEQCKSLVVDSFVRRMFHVAIDEQALLTEQVLSTKLDKDLQMEKDLDQVRSSSAATLAAQEARDRNTSFWNSSKWARKVTKGVVASLWSSGGGDATTATAGQGGDKKNVKSSSSTAGSLMNTSSVSRMLADGKHSQTAVAAAVLSTSSTDKKAAAARKKEEYTPDLFIALCRLFSVVLSRWGGGGYEDIVSSGKMSDRKPSATKDTATAKPEPFTLALLNTICFSTPLLRAAWGIIQSNADIVSDVYRVIDADRGGPPVRTLRMKLLLSSVPKQKCEGQNDGAAVLYMFTCALSHTLIVTDDVEIHDLNRPIPIHQLRRVIKVLKTLLHRACCIDAVAPSSTLSSTSRSMAAASNHFGLALISASARTMRDLHDRSSRRPLCVPKVWLVPDLLEKEIRNCKTHEDYIALVHSTPVLRVCPELVSFKRRLKLFERIVTTNRVEIQGENSQNPFHNNPLKRARVAVINRGRILEDGLATMNHLGRNMRERIAVHYVNEAGTKETGIDAGGLFKEFWTDLCAIAFDPNYALFQVTDGAGNCLFPSPLSASAHGSDHIILFEFLGRILGKALYEGITIQPRFAHFFLSFLRGDYNFLHMLPDLSTVDPQLYNNLMFLKTYDGDAADLCLSFTITNDDFGGTREIPLIPNGGHVDVTNENKNRYIGLVAKYYVVDRVKEQSEAFTRGLWEVIDPLWLRLFNEPELQVLISGASDGKLDVEDLRRNTRYMGGYTGLDRNVIRFWSVVSSLTSKQQADLLRFVTSCERPPPLGFSSLNPPFTIQRVGILRDGDKLPSASTCFNVLKLPTYSSEKILKQRLIYAIESGAGFELT